MRPNPLIPTRIDMSFVSISETSMPALVAGIHVFPWV
jgi:hypothetical protein